MLLDQVLRFNKTAVGIWPFTQDKGGEEILKLYPNIDAVLNEVEWGNGKNVTYELCHGIQQT